MLERYHVGALLYGGSESETDIDEALLESARNRGVPARTVRAVQSVVLSDGVVFDVLFPVAGANEMEPNTASVVGRLVYGESAVLLSGDAPKAVEEYLVRTYGPALESEVVKVGHHGSDTSSAAHWLGWSGAEYAVISAGEGNRHGHPHKEVLERLELFDTEVLETAKDGTVVFESNGESMNLVE